MECIEFSYRKPKKKFEVGQYVTITHKNWPGHLGRIVRLSRPYGRIGSLLYEVHDIHANCSLALFEDELIDLKIAH